MHYPLVVIYESSHRLANLLQVRAADRRWVLRQVRNREEAATAIPLSGPSVLLVEVGERLQRDLEFLAWAGKYRPAAALVVVLRSEHPTLAHLAWDLGARHVSQLLEEIPKVVETLVTAQWSLQETTGHDAISGAADR